MRGWVLLQQSRLTSTQMVSVTVTPNYFHPITIPTPIWPMVLPPLFFPSSDPNDTENYYSFLQLYISWLIHLHPHQVLIPITFPIPFTFCYLSHLQSYGPCASQTIDRTFMTQLPLWSYWTSYLPELVDTISNTVWLVYYFLACYWESTLPFSTLLLDSALPLAFDSNLNKPQHHCYNTTHLSITWWQHMDTYISKHFIA